MSSPIPKTEEQCNAQKVVDIQRKIKRLNPKAKVTNVKKADLCKLLMTLVKDHSPRKTASPKKPTSAEKTATVEKKKEEVHSALKIQTTEQCDALTVVNIKKEIKKRKPKAKVTNLKKAELCQLLLSITKNGSASKSASPRSSKKTSPTSTATNTRNSPRSHIKPHSSTKDVCKNEVPVKQVLRYANNGCYLDVLLLMLLAAPGMEHYADRVLLNRDNIELSVSTKDGYSEEEIAGLKRTVEYIKQEFARIRQYFMGEDVMETGTLRTIRRLLNRFDRIYTHGKGDDDFESDQMDPFDVMHLFARMFAIPQTVKTSQGARPIHAAANIYSFTDGAHTSQFIPRRIEPDRSDSGSKPASPVLGQPDAVVLDANELLVHVERGKTASGHDGHIKVSHALIPDEYVTLNAGKKLRLSAVIIHLSTPKTSLTNGHYTMMIRFGNAWYYYNDLAGPLFKCVGSYDDMLGYQVKQYSTTYPKAASCFSKALLYTKE